MSSPVRPAVIGILGGIAAGKSTVAEFLRARGCKILDADQIVQDFLEQPTVIDELVARLGKEILSRDGGISRQALAGQVFRHKDLLEALEGILHPKVRAELFAGLRRLLGEPSVAAVVLDVPLLLEKSPLRAACDYFIFVDCPAETRKERARTLRGLSAQELEQREAHQMPPEEKRKVADLVVHNDGEPSKLTRQLERWLERIGGFQNLPRRALPLPEQP